MLIYDSLCHIAAIQKQNQHLTPTMIPGTNLSDIANLVNLREQHPLYKIGFGIHPWYITTNIPISQLIKELKTTIKEFKPDFIGEIGLDYLKPNIELQKQLFSQQLELAKEFNLPVVIHSVRAYNDVLFMLKRHQITFGTIHAFNANAIIARQFIEQGFLLGVGSLITKKSTLWSNISQIPITNLIFESDAPFMCAFGKSESQSSDAILYAQIAAKQLNINLINLINYSNHNFLHLFRK